MKSNPAVKGESHLGADELTCQACGRGLLAGVHTIHPHPLRGPSYESVLLTCTHCGEKRLHTRPVQNGQSPAGTEL